MMQIRVTLQQAYRIRSAVRAMADNERTREMREEWQRLLHDIDRNIRREEKKCFRTL